MAKNTFPTSAPGERTKPEVQEQPETVTEQPKKLWRVTVQCPTPLAENPAVVSAVDADGAWQAFMDLNGISGTEHPNTIEPVTA